jgi:hypothetical protein
MTQIQPIPNKRIVDLTGNRCGRLTIIGFAGIELRGKGSSVGIWWAQRCYLVIWKTIFLVCFV